MQTVEILAVVAGVALALLGVMQILAGGQSDDPMAANAAVSKGVAMLLSGLAIVLAGGLALLL